MYKMVHFCRTSKNHFPSRCQTGEFITSEVVGCLLNSSLKNKLALLPCVMPALRTVGEKIKLRALLSSQFDNRYPLFYYWL